jgi:hypothetical protein
MLQSFLSSISHQACRLLDCSCDSFLVSVRSHSGQVMTQYGNASAQIAEGLSKGTITVVKAI